jgi:hypothetical protein
LMSAGITAIQTDAFRRFAHYLLEFPRRRPQNNPQVPNSEPLALPGHLVCRLCGIGRERERERVDSFLAKGSDYVYVGAISFFPKFFLRPSVLSQIHPCGIVKGL